MIRVGTAGWSYRDWEGCVYPRAKPKGFHPLQYLARYFDCIEINSSFYAMPRPDNAARWVELVRERPSFRFLAKLTNDFTHKPLPDRAELAKLSMTYRDGVAPLVASGRLAAVLLQFPHSFRATDEAGERLRALRSCFDDLPLAIEVRHRSWFEPAQLALLESLDLSLVEIDLPYAADHPPAEVPRVGPLGYLRLHGRNADAWFDSRSGRDAQYDYLYGEDEIAELVARARRLATDREETYVVTNNHFAGKAVANALEILAAISAGKPLAPVELVQTYPRLRGTTRVEGQGGLFDELG